ncbi:DUF6950 family protein [Rhizobium leguminosarum]|jgi:hypothetical protein|uniref:DUF6950 family protein n=1 Tax=Rhizobium leguminosarum TaxID=384 RepID=UPI001C940A1F|nr:hypothetical protein [Rhizobium leguminosarum]MBY5465293.1 hypothetical protein [Rhizobium leguminosarum]
MDIHHFLALPHRFRWGGVGGDDCFTFPAAWVLRSTGIDPAEQFRGTYRTREEAHQIIDVFGGPLALIEHQLAAVKAMRVQDPETGDIALIKGMTGETTTDRIETLIGAIRFGPLWACIHPAGIRATPAEFVAAWRLPV